MGIQAQIDAAEKNLERLIDWVGKFDTKASILLGIAIGMSGFLVTLAPPVSEWNITTYVVTTLSFALLLVTVMLISLATFPHTKSNNDSLLFFGTIPRHKTDEYVNAFGNQSPEVYLKDLLIQCHTNSQILNRKFSRLKWSYGTLTITLVPWVITIYQFRVIGTQ